jgi:hypothetical protein
MKNYAAGKSVFVKASADTFVGLIDPQRAALVYVAQEAKKIAPYCDRDRKTLVCPKTNVRDRTNRRRQAIE